MRSSDVLDRHGQAHRVGGPAFDLVLSKLRCPSVRPGTVRRSSLIERLTRDDGRPVVSVVAPAGYGKTTLLGQWAERSGDAFAWVSVDEGDNDPKVFLSYVAAALDAVEPVGRRVFDALASPVSSVPGSVVPRLAAALAARAAPVVLVVDDVHLLGHAECRARCRSWLIMCRPARGWCWPGGPGRRCGSRGCAPRARSPRSAPMTSR